MSDTLMNIVRIGAVTMLLVLMLGERNFCAAQEPAWKKIVVHDSRADFMCRVEKCQTRALHRLDLASGKVQIYHILTSDSPGLRWDIVNDLAYFMLPFPSHVPGGGDYCYIFRFPLSKLRVVPKGAWPLPLPVDGGEFRLDAKGHLPPNYGTLSLGDVLGLSLLDKRLAAYVDLDALDDERIRVFLNYGSDLSIWTYDGLRTTQEKKDLPDLGGPFRLAANGRSVLVRREAGWVVVEDVYDMRSRERPQSIEVGSGRDTLVLVYDLSASRTYLCQGDTFTDVSEKVSPTMPLEDAPTVIRTVIERVRPYLAREMAIEAETIKAQEAEEAEARARVETERKAEQQRLDHARNVLTRLMRERHVEQQLRQPVMELLKDEKGTPWTDDAAVAILMGTHRLDGADVLIDCYRTCAPNLVRLRLEETTKQEWKRYAELKEVLHDMLGGDKMLALFVRMCALTELKEQLNILKEGKGNEGESRKIESFLKVEVPKLEEELTRALENSDLKDMMKELKE